MGRVFRTSKGMQESRQTGACAHVSVVVPVVRVSLDVGVCVTGCACVYRRGPGGIDVIVRVTGARCGARVGCDSSVVYMGVVVCLVAVVSAIE